jgi:hypothetical protein
MPRQHRPNRDLSVAELTQKRAAQEAVREAERAVQDTALRVIERWNATFDLLRTRQTAWHARQ